MTVSFSEQTDVERSPIRRRSSFLDHADQIAVRVPEDDEIVAGAIPSGPSTLDQYRRMAATKARTHEDMLIFVLS
jgi:hypothetical protein